MKPLSERDKWVNRRGSRYYVRVPLADGTMFSFNYAYDTLQSAVTARDQFLDRYADDPEAAIANHLALHLHARRNSKSGIRGVYVQDNGYVVKPMVRGKRHYLGFFTSRDAAKAALDLFFEKSVNV